MTTFARNNTASTLIKDSTINIDNINNVDGVNPESIITFLPKEHDYSGYILTNDKNIILSPQIAPLTETFLEVYLDGQRLVRGSDYILSFNNLQLLQTVDYTNKESLIIVYIDKQNI